MPIKPIDLRRKEFKNSLRGYDANQVDDFMESLADEFERVYTENARMGEEISSLRERLQQFEELEASIRAALVHAEQAANDLRRAATREAEDLRQSAARDADLTLREAKARSHQMLAESSSRLERIQESYEALQDAKRNFTSDFRHLLKAYMDVMDNMEVASAREIEASLRQRLDPESIAVAHEAASQEGEQHRDPSAADGAEETEPEVEEPEVQPSSVPDPGTGETSEHETGVATQASSGEAASDVDREEPAPSEPGASFEEQKDSRKDDEKESRVFRASRFLRRRE
jgi:cell division initiation protein